MFTSLSSAHLILATIYDCRTTVMTKTNNNFSPRFTFVVEKIFFSVSAWHSVLVTTIIAVAAIVGEGYGVPFTGEVLYIGVTAVAAALAGYVFVATPLLQQQVLSAYFILCIRSL